MSAKAAAEAAEAAKTEEEKGVAEPAVDDNMEVDITFESMDFELQDPAKLGKWSKFFLRILFAFGPKSKNLLQDSDSVWILLSAKFGIWSNINFLFVENLVLFLVSILFLFFLLLYCKISQCIQLWINYWGKDIFSMKNPRNCYQIYTILQVIVLIVDNQDADL